MDNTRLLIGIIEQLKEDKIITSDQYNKMKTYINKYK